MMKQREIEKNEKSRKIDRDVKNRIKRFRADREDKASAETFFNDKKSFKIGNATQRESKDDKFSTEDVYPPEYGAGKKKGKSNPWIKHARKYQKEHNCSYIEALKNAGKTYKS